MLLLFFFGKENKLKMTKEMKTLPFVHLPRYMRKEGNILIINEDGSSKIKLIYKGKYPGIFPKEIKQIMQALDDPMLSDKVVLDYSSVVYTDELSKGNMGSGIGIVDGYEISESKTNVTFNMVVESENEEVM